MTPDQRGPSELAHDLSPRDDWGQVSPPSSQPREIEPHDAPAPNFRSVTGYLCPMCRLTFPETDVIPSHCPQDRTPLISARTWLESQSDPMVGRTLDGRFTMLTRLGAGSMGTVYRARQHGMERDVAVKILRSDRAVDDASKARFLREARANSALASPHTVTVFDFGQASSGELFLAMELLEGESLGQRLTRIKRMPVAEALDTAKQALRSLSEAHAKGIVHRDLKPDNLFYAKMTSSEADEEIVKVVDFGIAKMLGEGMGPINAIETQAGTVFGTPRYMSPEQAQAKPLDARSDLYSLGVLLYHMLTGRPPFTDDDAIIVMARHIKTPPRSMRDVCPEANIAPEVDAAIMRVLAKNPADRPATADAMAAELARAMEAAAPLAVNSGVHASVPSASVPDATPDDSLGIAGMTSTHRRIKSNGRFVGVLLGAVTMLVLGGVIFTRLHATRAGASGQSATPEATAVEPAATHTEANGESPRVDTREAQPEPVPPTVGVPSSSAQASSATAKGHPSAAVATVVHPGSSVHGSPKASAASAPKNAPSAQPPPAPSSRYGILE